jgi:hypothetical protein
VNRRGLLKALAAGVASFAVATRLGKTECALVDDPLPTLAGEWDGVTLSPGTICYAPEAMYASYSGFAMPQPRSVRVQTSPGVVTRLR